jgi:hypothetical protein
MLRRSQGDGSPICHETDLPSLLIRPALLPKGTLTDLGYHRGDHTSVQTDVRHLFPTSLIIHIATRC